MTLDEWERELGRWAGVSQRSGDGRAPVISQAGTWGGSVGSAPQGSDGSAIELDEPEAGKAAQSGRSTPWLECIEQAAMACEFEVLLNHGQYERGIEVARDALRAVHRLEDQLSVYRPTSDFSTINRFGHLRPVAASYDVCRILSLALDVSRATGRAFDITAGTLSEVWGFSRRQGRKPADEEIAAALENVGADLVSVDSAARTVELGRPGVKLNPGGIGKGYALDRVGSALVDGGVGDFLVHGGRSSVAARGDRHEASAGGGWWIAVAHPLRWEEKLGRVRLRNQALGTSGAGKQFFHYQGVRYSHVIDPRTGWPAQGVLSATAICRSGALADALATAFMVMGAEATRAFCAAHPSFAAILVSASPGSSRLEIDCLNIADDDWRVGREL